MSKVFSVAIVIRIALTISTGRICGSVTCHSVFNRPAPSTRAASTSSRLTVCSAA